MGLNREAVRFLISARRCGVDFTRTATLGRQNLYVARSELLALFHEQSVVPSTPFDCGSESIEYADEFFALLGAQHYAAIDASDYEGAVEIHDMNRPIPLHLKMSFDAVVDGGTLEHIFDFPTALKNCMEMVRVGGHLLLITPANNYCGHGFYQFSPDLYYRALSSENGFMVERMIAYEVYPHGQWYQVADPASVAARVELLGTDQRILLMVRARRTQEVPIFARPPQQSDYVATWSRSESNHSSGRHNLGVRLEPGLLRRLAWRALRMCGAAGERAYNERRARYFNRQLRLSAQPGAFKAVQD
jgi:hypothetical protein